MFKAICRCHRTIERHTNSPLAHARRRYLEHLAAGGANPSMMRNAAALMYRAVQLLDLEVDRPVKRTEVEQAAKEMGGRSLSSCWREWRQHFRGRFPPRGLR